MANRGYISVAVVFIAASAASAAARYAAPADEQELEQRIEELKAEYAPYLRSLPTPVASRLRTDLNGKWRFAYEIMDAPAGSKVPAAPTWFSTGYDDSGWETATVPQWRYRRGKNGTVLGGKDQFGWGERGSHSNIVWYRRNFEAKQPVAGRRLWLCFDGVDWEAEVYLNDTLLGRHRVRYEPFRFDITEKVRATNTLAVRIIDGRVFGEPHSFWTPLPDARAEEQVYVRDESQSLKGVLPIGYHGGNGFGILREVYLEQSSWVLVAGVFARNDLSGDEARVKVEFDAVRAGSYQTASPDIQTVGPPAAYRFESVTAKWLRILGRGSDKTEWNAIYEVECDALVRDPNTATASKTHSRIPPTGPSTAI